MDDALRVRAAVWYYREHFGFAKRPPEADLRLMAIALVTVANGDRQITPQERNWLVGYFAAKGYPPEAVKEAMSLAPLEPGKIAEMLQSDVLRTNARILIYDAIRVASVDGYRPGEEKAVREMASALGMDEAAVAEVEGLVREEHELRARRIKILMPEGHPYLDERYDP